MDNINWWVIFGKTKKYLVFADTYPNAVNTVLDTYPKVKNIVGGFLMNEYLLRKSIFFFCKKQRAEIAQKAPKSRHDASKEIPVKINDNLYSISTKDACCYADAILLAIQFHIDLSLGMFDTILPIKIQCGESIEIKDYINAMYKDFEQMKGYVEENTRIAIKQFSTKPMNVCRDAKLDDYDKI